MEEPAVFQAQVVDTEEKTGVERDCPSCLDTFQTVEVQLLWDVKSVGEYECAGAGGCADGTGRPLWGWLSGLVRICWRSQSLSWTQTPHQVQDQILSGHGRSDLDLSNGEVTPAGEEEVGGGWGTG